MGMFVTKLFIQERSRNWNDHLKRISPFLLTTKVWWKETENGFRFLDSDLDQDYHQEGPHPCHF